MINAALVRRGDMLVPYSEEDREKLSEIVEDRPIKARITAVKKERSERQLRLFWACCQEVAENADDPNWNTKRKVAEQIKILLRYVDEYMVTGDGTVHFITGSISSDRMDHMEACRFMDQAFELMAERLGITVDELLAETEERVRITTLTART